MLSSEKPTCVDVGLLLYYVLHDGQKQLFLHSQEELEVHNSHI
jgi:hypothetical protein